MLTGDGGDEMFAGYQDVIRYPTVDRIARAIPRPILVAGAASMRRLAQRQRAQQFGGIRTARRVLEAAATKEPERLWLMSATMESSEYADLTGTRLAGPDMTPIRELIDIDHGSAVQTTSLRKAMAYRSAHVLPDQMLVKSDRMSTANSLELRPPLLDRELGAIARRMDDGLLVRRGVRKWVLREAIRPWVPASVLEQPKRGFGVPLKSLRNEAFTHLCHDLVLATEAPVSSELFDHTVLTHCVERVLAGHSDSASESEHRANTQVWAMLVLAAWCRRFNVAI